MIGIKGILVIVIILSIAGMPLGSWCRSAGELSSVVTSYLKPEYVDEVLSFFNAIASILDYLTVLHTYVWPRIQEALG